MQFQEVLRCGKSIQIVVMNDTASGDSLASVVQVAAMEMYFISYVNRINHKCEEFGYEFLKFVICFVLITQGGT